jgi:hypothetical protein
MRPVSSQTNVSASTEAASDVAELVTMELPPNSFLINCTDQIGEHVNRFDPIVSEDALVLSPQAALGFSGPSAHALTHAWYLGVLGDTWRALARMPATKDDKHNFGIATFFQLVFAVRTVCTLLPPELVANSPGLLIGASSSDDNKEEEEEEAAKTLREMMQALARKMTDLWPGRYDDEEQYSLQARSVLMGKIGTQSKTTARL